MDNENNLDESKFRELLHRNVTNRVSSVGKDLMEFRTNFQQSAQGIIDSVSLILNSVEEEFLRELREEVSVLESGLRGRIEPELRNRLEQEVRSQIEPEVRQKLETEFEERLASTQHAGEEIFSQRLDSHLGKLEVALREISVQNSQVEILTAYLDKAALFAPRAALFVIKSGSLVGWQARGFEGEFNNASIKTLMFPADRDNFLRRVADTRTTLRAATADNPDVLDVVSKFGSLAPDAVSAIPLVVREKTVAVLYTDTGMTPNSALDCSSLEIITTAVSLTVELSSARAKLGIKPAEAPASTAAYPPVPPAPARPVTAPLPETESVPRPVPPRQPIAEPTPVATPSSEAPKSAAPPRAYPAQPLGEIDEAEQKLHNEAKRFARLLVSEIKLYNEQKVQAGRRDKNLYSLLRDDIDKSREMYEKRVSANVASKVDYFYEELVKILADNQVSALGADCPGPAIPA